MKTTPSIEAAREYLNTNFVTGWGGPRPAFKLIHRKERLWLCKETLSNKTIIVHICKPRIVLHYIQTRHGKGRFKSYQVYGSLAGTLADGSYWHTKEVAYRCMGCGKKFTGGVAFAIKVGIEKKDQLTK